MQLNRAVIAVFALAISAADSGVAQNLIDLKIPFQGFAIKRLSFSIHDAVATAPGNLGKLPLTIPSPSAVVVAEPIVESQEPDLSANPGRPAMATSALLTPIGYAQFENGMLYASGSSEFARRAGMEETMRLTVGRRLQMIVSAEPLAYSRFAQSHLTKRGDVTDGLQVVAIEGKGSKPTIALSYLRLVKGGGATDLDIGGSINSAVLLGSLDLGRLHIDVNGFGNETAGSIRRAQFGEATALTVPVRPKLAATLELRYFTQPLTRGNGFGTLLAMGYALRPNLVFDAGAVRGISNSSTQWQMTSGFTYLVPRRIWGF